MFNITPSEFLIIAVLGLIVLGPDRLPEMARNLGKMINKLKTLTSDLQETVESISDDPSMKPLKDLGELATRPRQKLAEYAREAEAEERAERIAREREEMDRAQRELEAAGTDGPPDDVPDPDTAPDPERDTDASIDSAPGTDTAPDPAPGTDAATDPAPGDAP